MEENFSAGAADARSTPADADAPKIRERLARLLPRLRRFARALARNPVEADDLVQAAVVRALARPDRLQGTTGPLPPLLGLISSAWLAETAARRRQQSVFTIEQAIEGLPDTRQELLRLQDALSRLHETEHRAVALVLIEGFPYREAADLAGMPLPALMERLARARQGLGRMLGCAGQDGLPCLPDDSVMAYVDGQMEAPARVQMEGARTGNEGLARQIAWLEALSERLHRAFDRTLDEPPPERLLSTARSAPTPQGRANVVPLKRRVPPPASPWTRTQTATLLGATLLAGFVLGELLPARMWLPRPAHLLPERWNPAALTAPAPSEGLPADGTLAKALSSRLAGDPDRTVLIGESFHSRSGDYCRTFALRGDTVLSGLACKTPDGWRVRMLTQVDGTPAEPAVTLPAGLSPTLQEELGKPLPPEAEMLARARNWKPQG